MPIDKKLTFPIITADMHQRCHFRSTTGATQSRQKTTRQIVPIPRYPLLPDLATLVSRDLLPGCIYPKSENNWLDSPLSEGPIVRSHM